MKISHTKSREILRHTHLIYTFFFNTNSYCQKSKWWNVPRPKLQAYIIHKPFIWPRINEIVLRDSLQRTYNEVSSGLLFFRLFQPTTVKGKKRTTSFMQVSMRICAIRKVSLQNLNLHPRFAGLNMIVW